MLKHGLLLVAMAFLSSDVGFIPDPDLRELSVTSGKESVQILGRIQYYRKDCVPIKTQEAIWVDSVRKSPVKVRPRLGVGVGLQEKAENLLGRQCFDEALKFYEQAMQSYGEVIQLSAGDPSPEGRTFRLQARMNTATIYMQVREWDAAREVLNATLLERDAYLPAITRLAEVELRSGKPLDSLAVTDRLRDKPFEDIGMLSVGQFWAIRAQAHCAIGDIAQANWEIEQARRSDPNVAKAKCRTGKG